LKIPDKGVEEHFSSSGQGKRRSCVSGRALGGMKVKFIPRDYQITLFRRMQNLRHKLMTVKEYTEEFYKLNIRAGH
jgi:hypothetical protein